MNYGLLKIYFLESIRILKEIETIGSIRCLSTASIETSERMPVIVGLILYNKKALDFSKASPINLGSQYLDAHVLVREYEHYK